MKTGILHSKINLKNSGHRKKQSKHSYNFRLVIGKTKHLKKGWGHELISLHFIQGLRKLDVLVLLIQTCSPYKLIIWKKKLSKCSVPKRFFSLKNNPQTPKHLRKGLIFSLEERKQSQYCYGGVRSSFSLISLDRGEIPKIYSIPPFKTVCKDVNSCLLESLWKRRSEFVIHFSRQNYRFLKKYSCL